MRLRATHYSYHHAGHTGALQSQGRYDFTKSFSVVSNEGDILAASGNASAMDQVLDADATNLRVVGTITRAEAVVNAITRARHSLVILVSSR